MILRELYPLATRRELRERIPDRTWEACKSKARALKVRRRVQTER
jgi:hypothetical protein